ncbi:MAG: flagellar type III secretion system protein FlhB [Planctomycetaceae bacterium]|nr:flagellar type III secretion system protein FlhB [Planctomycetaceae bacterium]
MATDDFGDKTHDATPFRRQKAREAGQVVRSQDLASAVLLCGGLVILWHCGGAVARFLVDVARQQLGGDAWLAFSIQDTSHLLARVCGGLAVAVLPVLGLLTLAALASHMGQFGFLFLPQKLALDWQRTSPFANWQRIVSWNSAVQLGLGLIKVLAITLTAGWCLWAERGRLASLTSQPTPEIASYLVQVVFWTGLKIGGALLGLALLDYAYRFWRHEQDLRMTTQQLKEEMKQQQGDPQIAARRKQIQRQMVLHRLSTTIPKADVVVTGSADVAVAIQYDHDKMAAPIVIAKGTELLAKRIRDFAEQHRVLIVQRSELAQVLYGSVEIGQPVPGEQYAAVAEIIRKVYELRGKKLAG